MDPRIVELEKLGRISVFTDNNNHQGTYKFDLKCINLRNPVTNLTFIILPVTIVIKAQSVVWKTILT